MNGVDKIVNVPAGTTVKADLSPFDRFGNLGGAIRIRAGEIGSTGITVGEVTMTLLIGSDQVIADGVVAIVGSGGVTKDTPTRSAEGGAGDPVTLKFSNSDGANDANVHLIADVINVA